MVNLFVLLKSRYLLLNSKTMAKAKKEGKKKKSRKSVLRSLRLIEHNNKMIKKYKEELNGK
jgi:hypothetical protein